MCPQCGEELEVTASETPGFGDVCCRGCGFVCKAYFKLLASPEVAEEGCGHPCDDYREFGWCRCVKRRLTKQVLKGRQMISIQPLGDRVVVRRPERDDEVRASGIVIPGLVREQEPTGKVLAVGPGLRMENGQIKPLALQVGDLVLYARWSGAEVDIEDEHYLILRETDVLAVLEAEG